MTDPKAPAPEATPEAEAPPENEIMREARRAKELKERAKSSIGWRTAAAAGLGIGSAALIAALLYTNRKD